MTGKRLTLIHSIRCVQMYMTVPPELAGQQELLMDSPGATKPAESAETPLVSCRSFLTIGPKC